MIERLQRKTSNRLLSSHDRALLAYLAQAGTWTRQEYYDNAPAGIPRKQLSERLRSWVIIGRIIKTRDNRYRIMGCV